MTDSELTDWLAKHTAQNERALGVIEGELRGLRETITAMLAAHEARLLVHTQHLDAHGSRIRGLELWRAMLSGAWIVMLAIIAWFKGLGR